MLKRGEIGCAWEEFYMASEDVANARGVGECYLQAMNYWECLIRMQFNPYGNGLPNYDFEDYPPFFSGMRAIEWDS